MQLRGSIVKKFIRKYARKNSLRASFVDVKNEPCALFFSQNGGEKADLWLLGEMFTAPRYGHEGSFGDIESSYAKELIDRGYDITTLEFKIDKLDMNDIQRVKLNERLKHTLP